MTPELEQLYHRIINLGRSGLAESVLEAYKLCAQLPAAGEDNSDVVSSALIETAVALENLGELARSAELYGRLTQDPGANAAIRANAALRLGLVHAHGSSDFSDMPESIRGHALWRLAVNLLSSDPSNSPAVIPQLLAYEGSDPPAPMLWGKALECLAYNEHVGEDEVDAIWNRMPAFLDEHTAGALMHAAFTLERQGHLTAARSAYRLLLATHELYGPVKTNAHFRLGVVLDAQGAWEEAIREYESAVESPHAFAAAQSEAAYRLAQARQMTEDYDSAAEMFARLRTDTSLSASQRAQAQFQYGICLLRSGVMESAIAEIEKCRAGHGEVSLKAEITLAEIYEDSLELSRARECYQRVLAHSEAEPVVKAAALIRLQKLGR